MTSKHVVASIITPCFVCPYAMNKGEHYVVIDGHPLHKKCEAKYIKMREESINADNKSN